MNAPDPDSPASSQRHVQRRTWRWWAFALTLVLAAMAIGWFSFKSYVRASIERQLVALELGEVEVGDILFFSDGVRALDVKFFQNQNDADPRLKLDELVINHPLSALVGGADYYDSIVLNGAQILIELDAAGHEFAPRRMALSELKLPADRIRVSRSRVVLREAGKPELTISGIAVTVENDRQRKIKGTIDNFLDASWTVGGTMSAETGILKVQLESKAVSLQTEQWSGWPMVPESFPQAIAIEGETSVKLQMIAGENQEPDLQAEVAIQQGSLDFPAFPFPLTVTSGQIRYSKNVVSFQDIVAKPLDGGSIIASGKTLVADYPIQTTFTGRYQGVAIRTWRKISPDIPEVLSASSTGTFDGRVEVKRSNKAILDLDTNASLSNVRYDQVITETLAAKVEIRDLVFDENQNFASIDGSVVVSGEVDEQSISSVFETFSLTDLQQQLAIEAVGAGKLDLKLPLSTIEDIKTWQLTADAMVQRGMIAEQQFDHARVPVRLDRGVLVFDPIQAELGEPSSERSGPASDASIDTLQDDAQISVVVRWPIVEGTSMQKVGEVNVTGERVPPVWVSQFFTHQLATASSAQPLTLERPMNRMLGQTNFEISLQIPTATPNDIDRWEAKASVSESAIGFDDVNLKLIDATMNWKESLLIVENLEGSFSETSLLKGGGRLNFKDPTDYEIRLQADRLPVAWALQAFQTFAATEWLGDEATDEWAKPFTSTVARYEVAGNLNTEVGIQSSSLPDLNRSRWSVNLQCESASIQWGGKELNRLKIDAFADSTKVEVGQFEFEVDRGNVNGSGNWNFENQLGSGDLRWHRVPLNWLGVLDRQTQVAIDGTTSGELNIDSLDVQEHQQAGAIPVRLGGRMELKDVQVGNAKFHPVEFDITNRQDEIVLENIRTVAGPLGVGAIARIDWQQPHEFKLDGDFDSVQLSKLIRPSSLLNAADDALELTGVLDGEFDVSGQLQPFDWHTSGQIMIQRPTVNLRRLGDLDLKWAHVGNDWKQSELLLKAFGGSLTMTEASSQPERISFKFAGLDAEELTAVLKPAIAFTGTLEGSASINEWSLEQSRWLDLHLQGSSLLIGPTELGDFRANAEYRNEQLVYDLAGSLLGGKLEGEGETAIQPGSLSGTKFPISLTLQNGVLTSLYSESNYFRSLRPLSGRLESTLQLVIDSGGGVGGSGRVTLGDIKWNRNLVSRDASVRVTLNGDKIEIDDVRADLKRGTIFARASLPLRGGAGGTYEADIRHLDLERVAKLFGVEAWEAEGLMDVRVAGQIDKVVTGRGYLGVDRASLHHVAGQSLRVPIQFRVSPLDQSGRVELRQSRFRLFDGNVTGTAQFDFGRRLDLKTNLALSNVNSGELLATLADFENFDQGKLSGNLNLNARGIRSANDLTAEFRGRLERSEAFQLPVLSDIGRAISGQNLANDEFDSDEIVLKLTRGQIKVQKLNFRNSLARIAISGSAFLDGRLALNVAGRVEKLDQPTLIDELLGSPLANVRGTPVALLASVAEFLSERIVFLKVGGTFDRPQVKVDAPQQLREELIRYFLRDRKILPFQLERIN